MHSHALNLLASILIRFLLSINLCVSILSSSNTYSRFIFALVYFANKIDFRRKIFSVSFFYCVFSSLNQIKNMKIERRNSKESSTRIKSFQQTVLLLRLFLLLNSFWLDLIMPRTSLSTKTRKWRQWRLPL